MEINMEEVKQYNENLRQLKERGATLNAEIEYTEKEIDNLCKELSAELGITVNKENIKQVYEEQLNKIQTTLNSGKAILNKINQEEQAINLEASGGTVGNVQSIPASNSAEMNNRVQFSEVSQAAQANPTPQVNMTMNQQMAQQTPQLNNPTPQMDMAMNQQMAQQAPNPMAQPVRTESEVFGGTDGVIPTTLPPLFGNKF